MLPSQLAYSILMALQSFIEMRKEHSLLFFTGNRT